MWTTAELVDAGCGGLAGVGQGSVEPARIVQLTARGTSDEPPLVLVGKGLTYDAGGVNLKKLVGARMTVAFRLAARAATVGRRLVSRR